MDYNVHPLDWTDEKVGRFWNYYTERKQLENYWFTRVAGDSVLSHAAKHTGSWKNVLDYGTGKGFLIDKILNRSNGKTGVYGCDFSASAVDQANLKYEKRPGFKGCIYIRQLPSDLPDNHFDVVFLLEVIEHLTEAYTESTMKEIYRVLKPGGSIVVTSPNDEDLELSKVLCPDCGAVFHKVQHLHSFSADSLSQNIGRFGFSKVVCKPVLFANNQGLMFKAKKIFFSLTGRKKPNLIYVGRK